MNSDRAELMEFVERWRGTPSSLEHVRNGENAVYELLAQGERCFLRITDDRHRTRGQLEAELDFIRFVSSRGVAAACPLPSRRGAVVETIQTSDNTDRWHAVMFAAAPGRHFEYFSADIDRPLFHAWGAMMGRLHVASRDFVPDPSRRRPSWSEQDSTRCDHALLPVSENEARREHGRIIEWLGSMHATPETWGMIHGDFERSNFVLDERTLLVYDFDDACYHWYLADIAHALWAFRRAPSADRQRFLEWFLEGYREECSLEMDVREHLSWFVRLRSLSVFLRRLREGGAREDTVPDGPWERRMRAGFDTPSVW